MVPPWAGDDAPHRVGEYEHIGLERRDSPAAWGRDWLVVSNVRWSKPVTSRGRYILVTCTETPSGAMRPSSTSATVLGGDTMTPIRARQPYIYCSCSMGDYCVPSGRRLSVRFYLNAWDIPAIELRAWC